MGQGTTETIYTKIGDKENTEGGNEKHGGGVRGTWMEKDLNTNDLTQTLVTYRQHRGETKTQE